MTACSTQCCTSDGIDALPNGVYLETVREGDGCTYPQKDEGVTIHYTAKLSDGTEIDSSRVRNEPLKFVVGRGEVIKAWDLAVPRMSVGQQAILTAAPEFAYGEDGAGGAIPGGATLVFDIELLEILEVAVSAKKADDRVVVLNTVEIDLQERLEAERLAKEAQRKAELEQREIAIDAMALEELRQQLKQRFA